LEDTILKVEGIRKQFPGVLALDNVRLEVKRGEIHALVGENGAGKSTLMKILTGVYRKDAGKIEFKGKEVEIHDSKSSQEMGIGIVYQEFNLLPHLTVAQNIFIGREPRSFVRFILNENEINQKTRDLLDMIHLNLDPRTKVSNLTVARQQMVEIAKALSFNSEVLILDEPTAALSESEIEDLFRIIRKLRNNGVAIIYITHRIEELKQISDRVTVMRDGHYVDTVRTQDATMSQIISMMVGRVIYESSPEIPENASDETVLEVKNLNRGRVIKNVSFKLKKGEILGFAGLLGAGRTEVTRAIFGADPFDSGEIYVKGRKVNIKSPSDAVNLGIGYLSEDRKRYGVALGMNVEDNIVLAAFKKFLNYLGWVNRAKTRSATDNMIKLLSIRTPSLVQKVKNLSGGNQQKIIVGKWLTADTDILFFDEPTRGIDVGAKSEIYRLLNDLAAEGKSIIMISSELPEILRMSHRIIVMCEGRITGVLNPGEATQEKIMQFATKRE